MAIQLNALKRSAALSLLNGIYAKTLHLYFFFGQINDFDADSVSESQSLDYINQTKNNIFAIKEVLPSDACFVVPRIDYQSNTEYKQYDTITNDGDYVYNSSNFSVYICSKKGTGNSTVEPSHTTVSPVTLSDGYTWRYIYTIPLALRDRFLTPEWIPVSNSLTENYFSNGGIDSVSIIDAGEGYAQETTSIVVIGSNNRGHGAILEPVVQDGKITSIIIHDGGYGYISPKIIISSPSATRQAVLSATLSKGNIRSSQALIQTLSVPGTVETVTITSGGTGYTSNLILSVEGDGSGATVTYQRNNTTGEVTDIQVSNKGEGYTWAKIIATDTPVIGGSGLETHINLSPIQGFGKDALNDLNAQTIMVYQNLSREKILGLSLENSIHQYGIIVNPKTTTNSQYPKSQITKTNYIVSIPLTQISNYPIGTIVYNEFPTTATTKQFIVEEQIIGSKKAGIRVRALNDGIITSGSRYYINSTVSFVADYADYSLSADRQFISGCYSLTTTLPSLFNINIFSVGKILTNSGNRYIIVATSSELILVSSIDGGTIETGDTLIDDSSNILTPEAITNPVFDKKTGMIISIERSDSPIVYGQQQSVSFRTIIKF